jgi:hypothetical protein
MSKQTKTSIVFVHGIWADGSSFSKLIPTLQREGHEVIAGVLLAAAQIGLLPSLKDAIEAVKRCGLYIDPAVTSKLITTAS